MASALHISISAEPLFEIFGLTITNSIFTTWVVMVLMIIPVLLFSPRLKYGKPSRFQSLVEFMIENIYHFVEGIAGQAKAKKFFPLIATFFFFILLSNWFGLLPGNGTIGLSHGEGLVPYFRAPTADLNTTLALSITAMTMVQVQGFKSLGFSYLKKFFDFRGPIQMFVGLLELLSEFSKILSFAFRLFGNIIAGEILLVVVAFIMPYLGPTPFFGLEIFVGFIQALVFMMLVTVFTNIATISHGDEEHN